jgi:hypothetical protein
MLNGVVGWVTIVLTVKGKDVIDLRFGKSVGKDILHHRKNKG